MKAGHKLGLFFGVAGRTIGRCKRGRLALILHKASLSKRVLKVSDNMPGYEWDVFISHASEDKESVARPLSNHLAGYGLKVWLDESELHLGDSLRIKIDAGLAQSRFGIVVLSPSFFAKTWTKSELDGLVARENDGVKVILPIWHDLDHEQVRAQSPILAGRLAASTDEGLSRVAAKIVRAIERSGSIARRSDPLFEGRLTKKHLLGLPEGSFLLSNTLKPDLTPALAEPIPPAHLREHFWEMLSREAIARTKCYVFEDAAAYRAHMAARDVYLPREVNKISNRSHRGAKKFDIELVRAYVAAGRSPPKEWRHLINTLSFDDEKYKFFSLDGLSGLTHLEKLDLLDIDPSSLDPLAKLKNLRWLFLSGDNAHDINALSALVNLEHLDLTMHGVSDIAPLSKLNKLKQLHIHCRNVHDISPLQHLEQLERLELMSTPIRDIRPLRALINLRTLDLSATLVEDVSALSKLHKLQNLSLWKTPVKDLSPLSSLEDLRTLELDDTNVEDLSPLRQLHNLRYLDLGNVGNPRGLSELRKFPDLVILGPRQQHSGKANIDPSEDWQIWYWRRHLSVSEEDLRSLIAKHGNSVAKIRKA